MQGKRIGRYEILEDRGGEWLAQDPDTGRKVCIRRQNDHAVWPLGLHHRNVLALHETLNHHGASCRVYEHASGTMLDRLLREEGSMQARRAAEILLGVLDGMAFLRERNVAHHGISQENVMVLENGTAMLVDLIEGAEQHATADVNTAGRMLHEMLTGKAWSDGEESDAKNDDHVDERLDAIVLKAIGTNPEDRYREASEMKGDLQDYLKGEPLGTLDSLLYRMQKKSDFPALSSIISEINKIVADDSEGSNKLARMILQDFALTSKLLKLVNTASYGQFGGTINTISKAVVILGFDTVRNIAVSLILMEFMQNKSQAMQLRDEMAQALMTGIMAVEFSSGKNVRDVEEVMVCSMFHSLGRMLVTYYFFDESQEISRLVEKGEQEDRASARVLGIPYSEIGLAVGRNWNFPPRLLAGMRRLGEGSVAAPKSELDHMTATVNLAHELCQVAASGRNQKDALKDLASRYERAVKLTEKDLSAAVEMGVAEINHRAELLGLSLARSPLLARVREWSGMHAGGHSERERPEGKMDETALDKVADSSRPNDAESMLSSGIQDVTASMVGEYNLNDVLQMVMETIYRSIGFSRILFLIRDNKQNAMVAKFGFGDGVEALVSRFRFSLPFAADVFHLSLEKGLDIAIENVDAPNIAGKIPSWFRNNVNAPCFILLPMMINGRTIAMFYADMRVANSLNVSQQQLSQLRTLRDQAVLAIKQKA